MRRVLLIAILLPVVLSALRICADQVIADGVISSSLVRVLAFPEKYNNKRIQLVGYYHSELEESSLYLTKDDATSHNYQDGLWVGSRAKSYNTNRFERVTDGFVKVIGTFHYAPKYGAGHMGLWPGSLDDITVFELRN